MPMGKSDNGEDLAGAGSIQFIYQNYIHMNIQLLIFLLFAIASAAIIFFLESSNHEPLELRSTSPLTRGNIQPVLEEFGEPSVWAALVISTHLINNLLCKKTLFSKRSVQ